MNRAKLSSIAAALVALAVPLAGCGAAGQAGGDESSSSVGFQMHWSWSPSTAGFAMADSEDLYSKQGVDVNLTPGKGSGTTVQLVSTGQADMGIADAVAITQAVEKGAPLLVVATINQQTNIAMQVLNSSGIEDVADLKGKSVAVPPDGAYPFLLPLFLEQNGLDQDDVDIVTMPFESMVPSLISGKVDAIVGGQDSHVALASQDAEFTDFAFGEYGVDAVAHSIFTTKSYAEDHPDAVRSVVEASLQGWNEARSNPDDALTVIEELEPDTVEANAREELDVLLPLLCASDAKYLGLAESDRWQNTMTLLQDADLVSKAPDPDSFVSYDYLPSQNALTSCGPVAGDDSSESATDAR